MANQSDQAKPGDTSILGDINPVSTGQPAGETAKKHDRQSGTAAPEADERSMSGGSNQDRTKHAGSRDVTEGTTGGTGTEVGGTRNFRTGTGATGGDIGNRPE
jgi:hypothetical protein